MLVDIVGESHAGADRTLLRVLDRDPALRASIHTRAREPEAAALDELLQFLET